MSKKEEEQQPEEQTVNTGGPVRVQQEDIQRVLDVDERWKAIVQEFGNINLAEINLKERREATNRFLQETKDLEQKAANFLEEKYGKGTLDVKTGIFTPLT